MHSKKLVLISVILGLCAFFSAPQVIGIDWGSEFFKVSLIAPGKSFVIIENTTSKRKTNNAMSFVDNYRIFESDTVLKRVKNPKNTLTNLQKFLGVPFLSASDQIALARKYFEENIHQEIEGRVGFLIQGFQLPGETESNLVISIEEAVAMILRHSKALAEKQAGMPIKDCVFTISPDLTIRKRKALHDAALLADLNVIEMINENTAAALYHALERQDLNQTHTVLFYNMGSSKTKVSVVEFSAVNMTGMKRPTETFKVLSNQVENDLGGWSFDLALANHFAEVFDNYPQRKGKESSLNIKLIMLKLMKDVVKIKEVLSANKEAHFYVEGLYDDIDFKSTITRATFEEKCAHIFERILNPVHEALRKANRTIDQIDIIELLGGSVRVPKVQQILSSFHGKELGQHLNGDESMALGAAFYAANFTRNFRVRQVWMSEGHDFSINASVSLNGLKGESTQIFEKGENPGTPYDLDLVYESDELVLEFFNANNNELIKNTRILNLTSVVELNKNRTFLNESTKYIQTKQTAPRNDTDKVHVYIKLKLSSFEGVLIDTTYAEIVEEVIRERIEEVPNEEYVEEVVNESNLTLESNATASTADDAENNKKEETSQNATENANENGTNSTEDSADNNTKESGTVNETPEPVKPKKTKFVSKPYTEYIVYHYPLEISEDYGLPKIYGAQDFDASIDKIQKLEEFEHQLRLTAESKNRLEAFIYEIRDLNTDEHFVQVSTEEERETLNNMAQESDDWLGSDEAFEANHTVFEQRYIKLNTTINPALFRRHELKSRDIAVNSSRDILIVYNSSLTNVTIVPPWVTLAQKVPTYELIRNTSEWLEAMVLLQSTKPLTENPAFTLYELAGRIQNIYDNITRLRLIPKPDLKRDMFRDKAFFEEFMANLTKNGTFNKTGNGTSEGNTTAEEPSSNNTQGEGEETGSQKEEEVPQEEAPKEGGDIPKPNEEEPTTERKRKSKENQNVDPEQPETFELPTGEEKVDL